jgi:hypothetical protein
MTRSMTGGGERTASASKDSMKARMSAQRLDAAEFARRNCAPRETQYTIFGAVVA